MDAMTTDRLDGVKTAVLPRRVFFTLAAAAGATLSVKQAKPLMTRDPEMHFRVPIGLVTYWAGNALPAGFMDCAGQKLRIADHADLYNMIGHSYGGDTHEFCLPDLRKEAPASSVPTIIVRPIICVEPVEARMAA
jgi:hypothetical protein